LIKQDKPHKRFTKIDITVPQTLHSTYGLSWLSACGRSCAVHGYYIILNRFNAWKGKTTAFSSRHYFCKPLTVDTGMFCYIHVNEPEERSPEIWHIPPQTPCIY